MEKSDRKPFKSQIPIRVPTSLKRTTTAPCSKLSNYYTYEEARRKRYGTYNTLLIEIYEAGCTIVDKFFLKFIECECKLLELNILSKSMGTKYPQLCATIIKKAIAAEQIAKSGSKGCRNESLEILYEIFCILENYKDAGWLLEKLYIVSLYINDVLLKLKKGRIFAKIHYRHGKYLSRNCQNIFKTLSMFREALLICHEESWLAEDLDDSKRNLTLHDYVALEMTKTLVAFSKTVDEPFENTNLMYRICNVLKELNQANNEYLFEEVILMEARYFREKNSYVKCLSALCYLERHIRGLDLANQKIEIICEIYYQQGLCYSELPELKKALGKFREVRLLAMEHNMPLWLGKALVGIGQIHEKYPTHVNDAKLCFKYAIDKFSNINIYRRNAARFALGNLMAKEVTRHVIRSAKKSEENRKHLLNLLNWKLHLTPFCEQQNIDAFCLDDRGSQSNVKISSKLGLNESSNDLHENRLYKMENAVAITDNNLFRYAEYLVEKLAYISCN